MSASATVIFQFDGSDQRFDHVYEMVCAAVRGIALDIGTYSQEGSGAIEFIVDDYAAFEAKITQTSLQAGIAMRSMNYLHSEESPTATANSGSCAPSVAELKRWAS